MNKYHKITPKMEKEIIKKHFEKRISQVQLAKEYGVSRRMIWYHCQKYNKPSPLLKGYRLDDKKIIQMYVQEKKSVKQIADILGITPRPIKLRLNKAGILKRALSNRPKWEKEIHHYRLRHKIWVAKVIEADGMICKMCGVENTFKNRLEANHIIPVRDIEDPEMLFDLNNGITLCRKCHMKIHYREYEFEKFFKQLISKRCSV